MRPGDACQVFSASAGRSVAGPVVALGEGAANEAVEPAHWEARRQLSPSLLQLTHGFLQLTVGALEKKGKLAHDFDRHLRKLQD